MRMFNSTYIDNGRTLARITISLMGDALNGSSLAPLSGANEYINKERKVKNLVFKKV